ncbi:MAG: hypothetical protein ACKVT0_12445 [Planctomycetaceae bacterium]
MMSNRIGWSFALGLCIVTIGSGSAFAQGGTTKPTTVDYFRNIPTPNLTFDSGIGATDRNNISNSHRLAQQQVYLALNYLLVFRENILSGNNTLYNSIFGDFYNTNRNENPFLGLYDRTTRVAVLSQDPIAFSNSRYNLNNNSLQFTGTEGSDTVTIESNIDGDPEHGDSTNSLAQSLRVGQLIFIGDPRNGGEVHSIREITGTGTDITIRLDSELQQDFDETPGYYVRRFEERPNTSHYNQVVNTFAAIRDALDQDTRYNGEFSQAEFDAVFASGQGSFTGLEDLEDLLNRPIDRAFRQDGYSHSNSTAHLDNIRDRRLGIADVLALLWTEDNSNITLGGQATNDEDRPYFGDIMTIFGELDNPNNQFVGRSFLEELISFAGDFFDPNTIGTTDLTPTEFSQWQMIIESFAEYGGDLDANDIAAINLMMIIEEFHPGGNVRLLRKSRRR